MSIFIIYCCVLLTFFLIYRTSFAIFRSYTEKTFNSIIYAILWANILAHGLHYSIVISLFYIQILF